MSATIHDISQYEDDFEILLAPSSALDEALAQPKTQAATTVHEPPFDFSLAGAGIAVLLWMALFVGFLYSWFTMGS